MERRRLRTKLVFIVVVATLLAAAVTTFLVAGFLAKPPAPGAPAELEAGHVGVGTLTFTHDGDYYVGAIVYGRTSGAALAPHLACFENLTCSDEAGDGNASGPLPPPPLPCLQNCPDNATGLDNRTGTERVLARLNGSFEALRKDLGLGAVAPSTVELTLGEDTFVLLKFARLKPPKGNVPAAPETPALLDGVRQDLVKACEDADVPPETCDTLYESFSVVATLDWDLWLYDELDPPNGTNVLGPLSWRRAPRPAELDTDGVAGTVETAARAARNATGVDAGAADAAGNATRAAGGAVNRRLDVFLPFGALVAAGLGFLAGVLLDPFARGRGYLPILPMTLIAFTLVGGYLWVVNSGRAPLSLVPFSLLWFGMPYAGIYYWYTRRPLGLLDRVTTLIAVVALLVSGLYLWYGLEHLQAADPTELLPVLYGQTDLGRVVGNALLIYGVFVAIGILVVVAVEVAGRRGAKRLIRLLEDAGHPLTLEVFERDFAFIRQHSGPTMLSFLARELARRGRHERLARAGLAPGFDGFFETLDEGGLRGGWTWLRVALGHTPQERDALAQSQREYSRALRKARGEA